MNRKYYISKDCRTLYQTNIKNVESKTLNKEGKNIYISYETISMDIFLRYDIESSYEICKGLYEALDYLFVSLSR